MFTSVETFHVLGHSGGRIVGVTKVAPNRASMRPSDDDRHWLWRRQGWSATFARHPPVDQRVPMVTPSRTRHRALCGHVRIAVSRANAS